MNIPNNNAVKKRYASVLEYSLFLALLAFSLFSVIWFALSGRIDNVVLAAITVFLISLPFLTEKIFSCIISAPFFLFSLVYAVCPLLGYSYGFYELIPYWDKLLHFSGGVVFAIVGLYIPNLLSGSRDTGIWERVIFAICFSAAISVFWEFCEFGADTFFKTDMQKDMYITSLCSSLLKSGEVKNIKNVIIDNIHLLGYIDTGLIDTMYDMLTEVIGAVIFSLSFAFSGRDVFRKIPRNER